MTNTDRGRSGRVGWAWLALAGVLAAGSVLGAAWPAALLDWRTSLAWTEPWRWWTAAWVHGSVPHRLVNLVGVALVGALGWAARVPAAPALAWLLAWPLTQLGWLLGPPIGHFFGLSGVLHAGAAVLGLHLAQDTQAQTRRLGGLVLLVLALKLVLENPFGPALRAAPTLGIAVAPWSHFSGSVAGLLCAGFVSFGRGALQRRRR